MKRWTRFPIVQLSRQRWPVRLDEERHLHTGGQGEVKPPVYCLLAWPPGINTELQQSQATEPGTPKRVAGGARPMVTLGSLASRALKRSVFDLGGGPMRLSCYGTSVEHPHDVSCLLQRALQHRDRLP